MRPTLQKRGVQFPSVRWVSRLLSNAWTGSPSNWENWLKCFLALPKKLRRIVNLKDDVLYGSKHRIITFQPSQTWVNWCFDWAGNDVPQNQKLRLYDEAGNYNSNSNSEQLSIKPCRFPFRTLFSTTVANSFYFQLSIIIPIISLHNSTSPLK